MQSGKQQLPCFPFKPHRDVFVPDHSATNALPLFSRQVAVLKRERALEIALHTLRSAGVEGVMVDVWWGICEREGPRVYDFSAYKRLFHKCAQAGLRVQVRGRW